MENTINKRNNTIDVAKGLGIIFVILGHVLAHDTYIGTIIYSFHMPLFFVVSGVFAKSSCEKYNFFEYLKKNIKALILPYMLFLAICILVTLSVPEWRGEINKDNIINALYYCNPWFWKAGHLWFLVALFEAKIAFYFYYKIILNKEKIWLNIGSLIALFIAGFYVESVAEFIGFSLPFRLGSAVMACAFFTLGYLLRDYIKNYQIKKNDYLKIIAAFICLAITIFVTQFNGVVDMDQQQYSNKILFVVFALSGVYATLALSSLLTKSRYLTLLGRESMMIYFVHYIVKNYYFYFAEKITGKEFSNSFGLNTVICFIVIMIIMSLLTFAYSKIKTIIKNKKKNVVKV